MMLLDHFGILVGFLEKGTKLSNLDNFGVLRHDIEIPRSSVVHAKEWHVHAAAQSRWRLSQASGTPRRSKAMPRRRPTLQRSYCSQTCVYVMFFYSIVSRTCLLD